MTTFVEVVYAIGHKDDEDARDTIVCNSISTAILWINAYQKAGWDMVYASTTPIATEGPPPAPPTGYTAEELERDNPYNQWMYE